LSRKFTPAAPEGLDRRDLPTSGVTGLVAMTPVLYAPNGILTVMGDDKNNTISVTQSGSTISALGKSFNT
jgi:hypothetical protein